MLDSSRGGAVKETSKKFMTGLRQKSCWFPKSRNRESDFRESRKEVHPDRRNLGGVTRHDFEIENFME
jgi:hypothetical protein